MAIIVGTIKGYKVQQLYKSKLKKDDLFEEIKAIDEQIKEKTSKIIEEKGENFALIKDKKIKAIYMFNVDKENETIRFNEGVCANEIDEEIKKEFEETILEALKESVALGQYKKIEWGEKVIVPDTVKVGKFNVSLSLIIFVLVMAIGMALDSIEVFIPIGIIFAGAAGSIVKTKENTIQIKKKNGITLIALIITIIVMLILVAVTITMAINGGLFGYAGNATKDTKTAMEDEKNLVDIESGLSTDELIEKYTIPEPPPDYSDSLLDAKGVLTKNAIFTDSNTQTAEIPKGFGVVEGLDIINQGLVISDQFDSNGNSIGNEFVWIPVNYTPSGNVDSNGLDSEFLSAFYRSAWSNNARSTDYTTSTEYTENASNDPTGKYNEMMISVQEHKGFYIGRYETGEIENGKIVVKRDKKPYNSIKWGDSMTEIGTTGAVYLSLNMYTGDSYGVTSTLCYGVQWDTTLDFIKDAAHNVSSSPNWGNYSNTNADRWKITRRTAQYYENYTWNEITEDLTKSVAGIVKLTTGANDNFQAKNIFDIAGNCYEWTMETKSSTDSRVARGGHYSYDGRSNPASIRYGIGSSVSYDYVGFRITLYL